MTGYTQEEWIGTKLSHHATFKEFMQMARKAVTVIRNYKLFNNITFEAIMLKKDGSPFPVEITSKLILNPKGFPIGLQGTTRDITDRKNTETQIVTLNKELEKRVRERTIELEAVNKELESFAYSISHDFRAPLRALDGFSASLQTKYDEHLDDEGRHYLDRIRNAAIYMSNLVDDLLDLSRITRKEFKKQQVDLSKLAAEIFAALQESEPQRQTTIKITPDLQVRGDAALLQSALQNLLENAWKFSSKEVQAEIEVGRTTVEGEAVFFIRDNGAGFNMAYADKLFGAFQRLHKVGEFPGTGIGLATVQRIVNRHGGRIWAESEVGKGATFYFTLPG
jgi:PAS domain S-box-containing protein